MEFSVPKRFLGPLLCLPTLLSAQYTDVINSNRPGRAVSAYAVGKNVVQAEIGLFHEQQDHAELNSDSNIFGTDYAFRYGLLFEELELNLEGSLIGKKSKYPDLGIEGKVTDFSRNRIGLKYLVYDPFKNPENNKPNLYSWRANNLFQWKNLIPAVSLYGGANFLLGDNPFYPGDPNFSYMGSINTQSRLTPRMVMISNLTYDRIGTDFPEWRFALSFSHAFRDPRWSVFVEGEGIKGDRYSDVLLRTGVARLISPDFQADFHMGSGFNDSPSSIFMVLGASYRLDFHKDGFKAIDSRGSDRVGSIKRKSNAKNSKKQRRAGKKGIDF